MWVSRDPEDPGEGGRSFANLTLASSLSSTHNASDVIGEMSLGEVSDIGGGCGPVVPRSCSVSSPWITCQALDAAACDDAVGLPLENWDGFIN